MAPILEKLEELKVAPEQVLCTHHHYDHVENNEAWQQLHGCPICGHGLEEELFGGLDRRLEDGDEIRLGLQGPVLQFELIAATPTKPAATPTQPKPAAPRQIDVDGEAVELAAVLSAGVQSLPRHPHVFSWWLLLCLGGLLLLPFPLIFWPLELGALAGWIVLGSSKDHSLVVVLRDGRALRHGFANRRTALAHRNGIRKALGAQAR